MLKAIIDNCRYCAAMTVLEGFSDEETILQELEKGALYCWLCEEDEIYHTEFNIYVWDEILNEYRPIYYGNPEEVEPLKEDKIG